jgi:FkbM family methyltransferase
MLGRVKRFQRHIKKVLLFRSLRPGDIAIDCGANVGEVTRRMARPGVRVFAFEPNSHAFKVLQAKFDGNSKVVCLNQAVADRVGTLKLYLHENSEGDQVLWSVGSSLIESKGNVSRDRYEEVQVVDLCEFIQGLQSKVRVLKIDIEGAEVALLNKFIDLKLHRQVEKIVVETHERIPELTEPTARLKERIRREKIRNIDLSWE